MWLASQRRNMQALSAVLRSLLIHCLARHTSMFDQTRAIDFLLSKLAITRLLVLRMQKVLGGTILERAQSDPNSTVGRSILTL